MAAANPQAEKRVDGFSKVARKYSRMNKLSGIEAPIPLPAQRQREEGKQKRRAEAVRITFPGTAASIEGAALTVGQEGRLHSKAHLIVENPVLLEILDALGKKYGANLIAIIADLLGRQINANERDGWAKAIAEASERHLWQMILSAPPVPAEMLSAHSSGWIYIHKAPESIIGMPYCFGYELKRVLQKGIIVEDYRYPAPKSFWAAVDTISTFVLQVPKEQTGAVGLSSVSMYLAPYFKKSGMSYDEAKDILRRMYFAKINMPWRLGNQPPFSNDQENLIEAKGMLEKPAVGGEGIYEDYYDEMLQLFKMILEIFDEPPRKTFPVATVPVGPDTPNWKLLDGELFYFWEVQARRGPFYFLNSKMVNVDKIAAFCCRYTYNKEELEKMFSSHLGGSFGAWESVGGKNVYTINLPRFAMEAKGDKEKMKELLEEFLREKFVPWLVYEHKKYMKTFKLLKIIPHYVTEDEFRLFYTTIGTVGEAETGLILIDEDYTVWGEDGTTWDLRAGERAVKAVREVEHFIKETAKRLVLEELDLEEWEIPPINLEEVPAETAASKLFFKDWKNPKYREYLRRVLPPAVGNEKTSLMARDILQQLGLLDLYDDVVGGKYPLPLYSNFYVPRWSKAPVLVIAYWLSWGQPESDGGVMFHFDANEQLDPEELKRLVYRILSTNLNPDAPTPTGVVYFSWSPVNWHCEACGAEGFGIVDKCPRCGSTNIDLSGRIVGWNTRLKNFSLARQIEFYKRGYVSSADGSRRQLWEFDPDYKILRNLINKL